NYHPRVNTGWQRSGKSRPEDLLKTSQSFFSRTISRHLSLNFDSTDSDAAQTLLPRLIFCSDE
ncbi:Guanine nucleotide-binding protein-like NSN1, partial [Clarias magur]